MIYQPVDHFSYAGRTVRAVWTPAPWRPPRERVRQCSGVCLTDDGLAVLVSKDGAEWALPGGHLDDRETLEQTLAREVREEACAQVMMERYLGCQAIHGTVDGVEQPVYYQARFWARVTLESFVSQHEIRVRQAVPLTEVQAVLGWQNSAILEHLIAVCAAIEDELSRV